MRNINRIMKYLHTYEYYHMDNSRTDTEIVKEDDAQEILYKLNHFNGEDEPIFRGVRISDNPDDIFIIDPKKHTRKSAYTTNHYLEIIDNSKKWKDYPKRSKSLICSSIESGDSYGQSYRVIPLEKNSNWGIAPYNDIWWSFDLESYMMRNLDELNRFIKIVMKVSDDNLVKDLETFEIKLNDPDFNIREYSINVVEDELIEFNEKYIENILVKIKEELDTGKTLLGVLENLLDPKENNFHHMNYEKLKDSEFLLDFDRGIKHELWTDCKCMLIPINHYEINNMNSLVKHTETY